jgi:hypothetical protein
MAKYEEARARITALKSALNDLTDVEPEEQAAAFALLQELEQYVALRQICMVKDAARNHHSMESVDEAGMVTKRPRLRLKLNRT